MSAQHSSPTLDKLTLSHETPPEVADTKYAGAEGFTELFFESNYWLTELRVPMGSKGKYQAHSFWKKFGKIVEYDPSGIHSVTSTPDRQTIHTISGLRVANITKPGLYIQNGKKLIVK